MSVDPKEVVNSVVTQVNFFNINKGNLLASGTVEFCKLFSAKFTIFNGKNGTFVSWPQERDKTGAFVQNKNGFNVESCSPVSKETRQALNDYLVTRYNQEKTSTNNTVTAGW